MSLPALPPEPFARRPFVYDLIYAPPQTTLLARAESAGCATMNGVKMLAQQGALSLSLWTGLPVEEIPVSVMEQAVWAESVDDGKKPKRNLLRGIRVYDIMVNAVIAGAENLFWEAEVGRSDYHLQGLMSTVS